ncbi:hypothetical protein PV11_08256 [Exophiala sideris]|uniref:Uncharacterized protein n=1 Tax=Exophiala sideris TaxID=1016849 RepID=A0A0D1YIC1_9EURO|nr:hypothetical protein PV11_08256 [Exophiala sideris]
MDLIIITPQQHYINSYKQQTSNTLAHTSLQQSLIINPTIQSHTSLQKHIHTSNTMGFFSRFSRKNNSQQEGEEKPVQQHQSVRDLEARAYSRWVAEGNAEGSAVQNAKRNPNSFEAERARRRSLNEDASLVLRS